MDETKTESTPIIGAEKTLAERVDGFNTELKALLGKYELALGAEARVANGQVLADPKVIDAREMKKEGGAIAETITESGK